MAWLSKSVRGRFLAISAIFLVALACLAVYTRIAVKNTARDSEQVLKRYYTLEHSILFELTGSLQTLENGLYRYALVSDPTLRKQVQDGLSHALDRAEALVADDSLNEYPELKEPVAELRRILDRLRNNTQPLLDSLADAGATRARRTAAVTTLDTSSASALAALDQVLMSIYKSNGHDGTLPIWQTLQRAWVEAALDARMTDSGDEATSGAERHSGLDADLKHAIDRLKTLDAAGALDKSQTLALGRIAQAYTDYRRAIETMSRLKHVDRWRSQFAVMREDVRPLFDRAWALSHDISEILSKKSADAIGNSLAVSDRLVALIWAFALFALVLMSAAYLAFARYVHRPLQDIVQALGAAGRGEPYTLEAGKHTEEINKLHDAFDNMVEQVRSRQARLKSILENVSDGIITIDRTGTIETFNRAAQRLFGYTLEETIGNNVTMLMPEEMRGIHDQYMIRYQYTGERHAIGREREETAQRKDGTFFPMSIKVSEVVVDGRQLFTAVVSDISERKAAMEKLRELAEHDSLTGLYNRRYFLEELSRAVERASRARHELTLLYLDLDNFKFVNDTLGHQAGDELLIEITGMLSARVRKGDLFARLGGDEFAVLLYDVSPQAAQHVAENYRSVLAEYKFMFKGKVIDIGCSIGVAPLTEDVASKEDLLARADLACHIAKSAGRNRVHVFDAENQLQVEGMSADMGWARSIKDAIASDGFMLLYQPIVDSDRGRIHSHEALLRMRDKGGGLISPVGFLSAAERFGLMVDIDRWVISHVIADLAATPRREATRVNINLSAKSIDDPSILAFICSEIEQYDIDPRLLTFEITETTAITNLGVARNFFEGLRQMGCHAALDDFGTGYSSFAYLKELPVDYIKIDGGFVQNLDSDYLSVVMVRAMHDVATAMGKKTVAEFVESEAVREILRGIGINYQQGNLVGQPSPSKLLEWQSLSA